MMFGLHLRGGGAKGAFQAGLLCAFWQRGVNYSVVTGTSIGAINGWFVLHNAYKELEELYLGLADDYHDLTFSGLTIDNSRLIDRLRSLKELPSRQIDAFYVNYVAVRDGQLREFTEDLKGADPDYAMERIGWSSLLPYNQAPMTVERFQEYAAAEDLGQRFQNDLARHVYDGLNLDGGMVNNQLIRQVFNHPAERVIVIGYTGTREEYINELKDLPVSDRERITYISSDTPFAVTDTYNFDPGFLSERFREGYRKGMDYPLIKLTCK